MTTADEAAPLTIGISLKMYFGHRQTLAWSREVVAIARRHRAVRDGLATLVLLPSFPALTSVLDECRDSGVQVGAQDLSWADAGAFTGEVSGTQLREIGCTHAEVGHAERRRLLGEDEEMIAAKTAAALRNGLVPLLCVGEAERGSARVAASTSVAQVESALSAARRAEILGPITVAYEPQWAIGAAEPAEPAHVREVGTALRRHLAADPMLTGSRVVYGGSAGPGLLTELADGVDGLFLGRFAHDPAAVESILDEAAALGAGRGVRA
ncbi:triose-phosphate isomerase family protein [Actinoalloteichus fjordicus]|uniref:Triosephosphate isomerase n=1 Tax=Actinoalloteichus fjordicus TaxID=1612552 RepID=A0AAC9LE69_9PSEU|nr:triose-phosphate isomerase family protein [Actinoalloteichus fjordicus]APU16021.1 triosephosphate isomerase [Actinoalloteichus fjordicus]